MNEVIYTCDACHYIFAQERGCEQCPDCGKRSIREATAEEQAEYSAREHAPKDWC